MEDAFTIGEKLKQEALETKQHDKIDASWQMLRSDIYVRDKGICWICNTFVELKDYDLGHLVDRCNNGADTYDNLAVMHKSCNLSKPKHNTLEEAMKWKLTPKYLSERPISMFDDSKSIGTGYPYAKKKQAIPQLSLPINTEKELANKQLINTYFQAHPELSNSHPNNTVRLEAIKLLSQILNIPEQSVAPSTNFKKDKIQRIPQFRPITEIEIQKDQQKYDEQVSKIKAGTMCWKQGNPTYREGKNAPLWRILPPPYTKEVSFVMRRNPPNVIDISNSPINSLQIIGDELEKDIDIIFDLGCTEIHITTVNKIPHMVIKQTNRTNSGSRSETVGYGRGQIPIEEWDKAKAEGIPFKEFVNIYQNRQYIS